MKKLFAASLVLAFFVPAVALARAPTHHHVWLYSHLRARVVEKDGKRAPGRNIVRWGLSNHHKATDADVMHSVGVFYRILYPRPVIVARPVSTFASSLAGTSQSTTTIPSSSYTTSGSCGGVTPYAGGGQCWAIPWGVVSCESGGQNVPNRRHSGANGYYQLMKNGTGSRSEQDQAAAQLWNGGVNTPSGLGPSNWTCAGG